MTTWTPALVLAAAASFAMAQPTVTFSMLPQGCISANDMSSDGRYIVGGWDLNNDLVADGSYLYDTVLGTVDVFGTLGGQVAQAISDDGTIATGNMPDPAGSTAGKWTAATDWNSIGFLPNALSCPSRSSAYEVSNDGNVFVGLSWDGCSGRAYRWTEGGGMEEMEVLANGGNRASVVSSDGSILAGFCQTVARTPCFWDGTTGMGTIIDPNGAGTQGEVRGMSDDGSTLLMTYWDAAFPTKDGWYDAYKWTAANGPEMIGTGSVVGGWAGAPMDIAEDTGSIVGFDFMMGNRRAWIQYEGTGGCQDLITFIESNGGDVPDGQYLDVCQAITNDGSTIIGHGFGNAWMVTIDEGCDVDMNGDGILDNGDIGTFVSLFLAQDMGADMNGDGILDNGDIGTFVAAFLAGC